jgi:hypothetical protein
MGRGARRYIPPGRITNQGLLDASRKEGKKDLKIGKDYRAVNYNVWRFYELVHGGGNPNTNTNPNTDHNLTRNLSL